MENTNSSVLIQIGPNNLFDLVLRDIRKFKFSVLLDFKRVAFSETVIRPRHINTCIYIYVHIYMYVCIKYVNNYIHNYVHTTQQYKINAIGFLKGKKRKKLGSVLSCIQKYM